MSQRKYRVGIIGLSGITSGAPQPPGPRAAWQGPKVGPPFAREIIISHAACLALMDNVELVGYCDIVPEMIERFGETWGSTWPEAKAYTDYKKMLAEADLDILTVGTGDNRHADMVVDGANAGVKAILCEKPLATSIEDANRMIEACENNDVPLSVGHTRAWDPIYHKIRDMIREGAIGPLASIIAIQGGTRAMMFRNGTHILHGVTFFADADPTHVSGVLEEGFDHWTEYKGDGGKKPENDPAVSGMIFFENGVRAMYQCNKNTYGSSTLHLSGPKGEIVFTLNAGYGDPHEGGQRRRRSDPGNQADRARQQLPVHGLRRGVRGAHRPCRGRGQGTQRRFGPGCAQGRPDHDRDAKVAAGGQHTRRGTPVRESEESALVVKELV